MQNTSDLANTHKDIINALHAVNEIFDAAFVQNVHGIPTNLSRLCTDKLVAVQQTLLYLLDNLSADTVKSTTPPQPNIHSAHTDNTIPVKIGSLFSSGADLLVQQVNCQGVMGAGLAKQIAFHYPEVYREYKAFCQKYATSAEMLGKVLIVETYGDTYVANIFAQDKCGRNGCFTDYAALKEGFTKVAESAKTANMSVAIPYGIGCGLAGGNWEIVNSIIAEAFVGYPKVSLWRL